MAAMQPRSIKTTRTPQIWGGIIEVMTKVLVVTLVSLLSFVAFGLWGWRTQIVGSAFSAILAITAAFWGDIFPKRRGLLGRAVKSLMEFFDGETLRWILIAVLAAILGSLVYFGVHHIVSQFSGDYANQIAGPFGLGFFAEMVVILNMLTKTKQKIRRYR